MHLNLVMDYDLYQAGITHYHPLNFDLSPHIATFGASGSGKTFLNKLIAGRVSLHIPDAQITCLDFKADDYKFARGTRRLYEFDAVKEGMEAFYAEFLSRQRGNNHDRSFRLLVIEELGSMLGYFDKKVSEEIKGMIANMIFLGRSLNVHLLVSTQRPDTSHFNSGVRDSISTVIGLSGLTKEAKAMMFSGYQDEMIHNHSQGSGYMLVNSALHAIKVPRIRDVPYLERVIRDGLDRV